MKYLYLFTLSLLFGFPALSRPAIEGVEVLKQDTLVIDINSNTVANAGDTIEYVITITNSGESVATGIQLLDTLPPNTVLSGSVNSSPVASPDLYAVTGNIGIDVAAISGLLLNDSDPDGGAVSVTSFDASSEQGGVVSVGATGTFTYDPPAGYTGLDRFSYTIQDNENESGTGTVILTVSDTVWFLDNTASPTGANGTLLKPFPTTAAYIANAADGVGDVIFVFQGNGSNTGYRDGFVLKNSQRLLGQRTALTTVNTGITFAPHSRTLPSIAGPSQLAKISGPCVTLASNNLVSGLGIQSIGGAGILGTAVGTVTIETTTINATNGTGIDLSNGALNVSLSSVFSSGAANGIRLNNTTGSFTVTGDGTSAQNNSGGQLLNCTGNAISLNNATSITLNQMTVQTSGASGVHGRGVSNLIIRNSVFTGCGNAPGEHAFDFDDNVSAADLNLSGACEFNNVDITNFHDAGISIYAESGALTLSVLNGSDITNGAETGSLQNGIRVETVASASAIVTVQNNTFDSIESDAVVFSAGGSGANDLNVVDCTVINCGGPDNLPAAGGVALAVGNDASVTFDIKGNTIRDILGVGVSISSFGQSGDVEGRIGGSLTADGNTILGESGATSSVGIYLNDGLSAPATQADTWSILIQNNFLGRNAAGSVNDGFATSAISSRLGDNNAAYNVTIEDNFLANTELDGLFFTTDDDVSGSPTVALRIANNSFDNISPLFGLDSIFLQSADTSVLCTHIAGNNNGAGGSPGSCYLIFGGSADDSITQASTASLSSANNGMSVLSAANTPIFNGSCSNPTLPANP